MIATTDEFRSAFSAFKREAVHGMLNTDRYRMQYFVWGSGPPVVFVHGMADASRAFVLVMHRLTKAFEKSTLTPHPPLEDSWRPPPQGGRSKTKTMLGFLPSPLVGEGGESSSRVGGMPLPLNHFTCIGYELPNGLTDGSRLARYTHREYTADLVALLDHLKLPRAAVVGSSFGSTVMLAALAAAPDRFTHGVSQNGFAHRPLNRWQRQLARSARFWPGWFADWPEIHRAVMWQVERPTLSVLPSEVAELFLANGGNTPIRASALRSLAIDRVDLRPQLPTIRVPMLLLTGDRDPLVPRVCADTLERGLPNTQRIEFTNCGHYPQYTHPGPMADAIKTFLV